LFTLSVGNKYTVYPQVTRKEAKMLVVHINAIQVYFERITALRDNPFVNILINVPFDTSVTNIPLKTTTITIKPICVIFLKNCVQESNVLGSGITIDTPSGIKVSIIYGV